jgi:hypothetical protein
LNTTGATSKVNWTDVTINVLNNVTANLKNSTSASNQTNQDQNNSSLPESWVQVSSSSTSANETSVSNTTSYDSLTTSISNAVSAIVSSIFAHKKAKKAGSAMAASTNPASSNVATAQT